MGAANPKSWAETFWCRPEEGLVPKDSSHSQYLDGGPNKTA